MPKLQNCTLWFDKKTASLELCQHKVWIDNWHKSSNQSGSQATRNHSDFFKNLTSRLIWRAEISVQTARWWNLKEAVFFSLNYKVQFWIFGPEQSLNFRLFATLLQILGTKAGRKLVSESIKYVNEPQCTMGLDFLERGHIF